MKKHIKVIYEDKSSIDKSSINISVIIPCAGSGKRMMSYGPKGLINFGKQNIINNQINIIKDIFKKANITIVCGFEADKLMKNLPSNITKIENENYHQSNVSRSISMGLRANEDADHVLILYGDLICNRKSIEKIKVEDSCIVISDTMRDNEVGCNINQDNMLEYMMYDLPNKWGHIVYLKSKELDLFKQEVFNRENDSKFGFEIINNVINKGGKFFTIKDESIIAVDIDTSKDLKQARVKYENYF